MYNKTAARNKIEMCSITYHEHFVPQIIPAWLNKEYIYLIKMN